MRLRRRTSSLVARLLILVILDALILERNGSGFFSKGQSLNLETLRAITLPRRLRKAYEGITRAAESRNS